jgi:phosphoglycolate phosphatase-like HAD superfamily hydrolase
MTDVLKTEKHGWTSASAILFDLDGVLTPTATVHERAWKELFEGYLSSRPDVPGYREEDYFDFIDGKPRFDGVRDFLASRGIVLPEGEEPAAGSRSNGAEPSAGNPVTDDPAQATVQGLGNRKNRVFNDIVSAGVEPFEGSVRFLEAAMALGL